MAGPPRSERQFWCIVIQPFYDKFPDHPYKTGMCPNGGGSHHVYAQLTRKLLRFCIKVIDHFKVI
jgi:hypothetical protein